MKTTIFFATLCVGVLISFVNAQSTPSAQTTSVAAQLRDRYTQLSQEIYATHLEPGSGKDFANKKHLPEVRSELRDLIEGQIEAVLSLPSPRAEGIASAINAVQGEDHSMGKTGSNAPWADFFSLGGARQVAVAYYTLEGGDGIPDTHAHLDFCRAVGTGWTLAGTAPTEEAFRRASFYVSQIDSGVQSEVWFIAWGTTTGDTGARLRIRLYGYDGASVRTIWQRDGLTYGQIRVNASSVTLDYDKVYKSEDPNNHIHQTLNVTRFGLE